MRQESTGALTRLYARAVDGERAVDATPRNRGDNVSLIGALSLDGLIAAMTLKGSVNTPTFLTYVSEVLAPQLWQGAIVVMDNLRVHYAESVRQAGSKRWEPRRVFLPPYSPELSPIELCWSKLKQFLRSCKARSYDALDQAMTDGISYISEDDAWGWFNHCGLFT